MAVNLSPVGGVAAQFFTNNGVPLAGGKIFTYAAGTTTPAATFTSSNGATAWTNPIVLDSAGRVSGSGEIWLTDGILYKFILKDANDVLIATYDNISGINSNFIAFVNQQEIVTATAGQTVFNLGISYQPATNSLSVFVDGVNQYGPGAQYAYVETDANTVTFTNGLHVGAEVKFTTTQQQSAGAVDAQQVTYKPPFTGSVATNVEAKLAQTVSVLDFGADPTGATDSTAAIQAAVSSFSSSGGTVLFPAGNYLLAQDGVYVAVATSNIRLVGEGGAFVSSPNSSNPEVLTGTRYLNGFTITGNNCVVSVDMRGPAISWTPSAATDCLTVRDMKMYNLYVGGIYISGTDAFDKLIVENVVFQDSRDLTSDSGNYEMIQRSSASTDPIGEMVVVSNCLFRSVSGGIDVHNVRNVMVCNGTRFEGVDINCVKLATSNNGLVLQNLTVDETVVFDGTAINPASANRHIACSTPLVRTVTGYTAYLGFIQVFNNVQFHGKAYNFNNNYGFNFLDGSYIDAVLNFDRSVWGSCFNAIVNVQGTVSMCDMQLTNGANIFSTSISAVRSLTFKRNRMINSWAAFTKRCVAAQDKYDVQNNVIDYNVNNSGALRFVNYGTDTGPTIFVDNNVINITGGGNTLAITDQGTGTRALLGANNVLASGNTFTAQPLTTYEQATAAYTGGLSLPLRNNEISVVNTNATGTIVYVINDATSPSLPVGTVFNACRTSAAQSLAFSCASGINGFSSATLASQFAAITLKKIASNSWVVTSTAGTVNFA